MLAYCHIAITALVPPSSHKTISAITGAYRLIRDKGIGPTHDGSARHTPGLATTVTPRNGLFKPCLILGRI